MGAVLMAALAEALPALLEDDLAGMEQRLRQVGRAVLGPVVARVAAVREAPESGVLAVEVDEMFVHRDDDWHDMKVVTVAPLGPGVEVDADTGRERLCWGRASYGAGFEEAQAFWGRGHVEACCRSLGTPTVHTVVALGDGAEWIWRHARAYLALPGVEVVELIDLYHAYEYLWPVGNTVFLSELSTISRCTRATVPNTTLIARGAVSYEGE